MRDGDRRWEQRAGEIKATERDARSATANKGQKRRIRYYDWATQPRKAKTG